MMKTLNTNLGWINKEIKFYNLDNNKSNNNNKKKK